MENTESIKVVDIAKMIDHSVLHPIFTDDDLKLNCDIARKYNVAAVCVKPYQAKLAADLLGGSEVKVCTVVGFPHGNSSIGIKAIETIQAIKDGATEIDMVVNIGKVLQQDWNYIELELGVLQTACVKQNAILKVIFETDYITDDSDKIKLCQFCSELKVAFVKTSTGFGFVRGDDGRYSYSGATEHNVKLMREHCSPEVQIKAAGGIRTLDQVLIMRGLGAARIGATATVDIMEEAIKRLK